MSNNVNKHVRLAVIERDKNRCQECGILCSEEVDESDPRRTTIDHVIPLSRGGKSSMHNLQVLCYYCNQQKADEIAFSARLLDRLDRKTVERLKSLVSEG